MINYDDFKNWVENHFDDLEESNGEIKVNSIFTDDTRKHLWCNPAKNAYHCWKTDQSGNLYQLIAQVSGCNYSEAVSLLGSDNVIRSLEEKLDKFFNKKYQEPEKPKPQGLALPPYSYPIQKLANPAMRKRAEEYLSDRKINPGNLLFCICGKHQNRIIIPYYGPAGNLIYWNSRDIGNSKLRYLGPDSDVGVGKGDVIYMQKWPESGCKIYLTEGEFDALSLNQCGLSGAACGGKELSDQQIQLIRNYKVCICFDTDKSGTLALNKIGDKLIANGMQDISYVRPPIDTHDPSKKMDWNRMLVEFGERIVALYIAANERPFTYWTSSSLRFNHR